MIQVKLEQASLDQFVRIMNEKIAQGEYMASPTAMTEMAKAMFTITAKKFLIDLSIAAASDPKRFHHLYEWGEVGNPAKKLFIMRRATVQYGILRIAFIPLRSTKPVPIKPILKEPGSTGKIVTTQSFFRDKMEVMEEGREVTFVTTRTIAFSPDGTSIQFVPRGKVVHILHPGGPQTAHALSEFAHSWYRTRAPQVVDSSRLVRQIANSVARLMESNNSTVSAVASEIRRITSEYSQELVEL